MTNNLQAHHIELKKPIESNKLIYFEINILNYDESGALSSHWNVELKGWIFNLPKGDNLLVLGRNTGGKNVVLFQFLNEQNYKTSLTLSWRSSYKILFCDGYIYILGYDACRCKVVDEFGNAIKHFKWIKMPNFGQNTLCEYFSCIKYYDKLLITEALWDSLNIYDEIVNSYSLLPVILRTGCKILSAHELKIYIITFSGPIYVNVKGNLLAWNILSINFFDYGIPTMISSVYYGNSFYISNNGDFYKFDFAKENLEKYKP